MYPLSIDNTSMLLSGVEVGVHYYWEVAGFPIHGQVFIVSWFVILLWIIFSFLGANNPNRIP
jgi:F-type H+-transporting ATPase subunit a